MPKRNPASAAPQPAATPDSGKLGWRINEWSAAIGGSRSNTYNLLKRGEIVAVHVGTMTVITTSPAAFLARLIAEQQAEPAPGPVPVKRGRGRPRKVAQREPAPAPAARAAMPPESR